MQWQHEAPDTGGWRQVGGLNPSNGSMKPLIQVGGDSRWVKPKQWQHKAPDTGGWRQ